MREEDLNEMILHSLSLDELKDICRAHGLKGFSKLKKPEFPSFIQTSLSQEELTGILRSEGAVALEKAMNLGVNIATGNEVREKLVRVTDAEGSVELDFKGLQWTQTATVKDPVPADELPQWTCTCRTAQDGGICPHFYVSLAALSQLRGWPVNTIPAALRPEGCEQALAQIQINNFLASEGAGGITYNSPEDILRGFFANTGSNDLAAMERKTKDELLAFAQSISPDLSIEPKWTKKRIIGLLIDQFGEDELQNKFKNYRLDEKFAYAEQYMVDIKALEWVPVEMVVANLQRMDSHDIVVEGTKIQHEGCEGWRNIRPKFCTHLLALFTEVAARDPERALKWLKKLSLT